MKRSILGMAIAMVGSMAAMGSAQAFEQGSYTNVNLGVYNMDVKGNGVKSANAFGLSAIGGYDSGSNTSVELRMGLTGQSKNVTNVASKVTVKT